MSSIIEQASINVLASLILSAALVIATLAATRAAGKILAHSFNI